MLEAGVERHEAERILEECRRHPDGGDRARHRRRNRYAIHAAARREREIGDRHDRRGARLLEFADDEG